MKAPLQNLKIAALRATDVNVKQSVVALQMSVQEPAISKLEKKRIGDTSVDKLIRYINAIGGEVDITIRLPDGSQMALNGSVV